AHIWFSETKTPAKKYPQTPFLGVYDCTGYALLYNGILGDKTDAGGNVLTNETLHYILSSAEKQGYYFSNDNKNYNKLIIYGEATRLPRSFLRADNIQFKQLPYEVKVW
ncbi:MAG: hypothetical protein LBG72_09125, partial [Spirochaetaceae bacterium]|nr:hypothetical protein [Spirochaetaceae bacterium]